MKYQHAIFKICQVMIEREEFPSSFKKTTLHMIWKRKGAMDVLSNNRFLHMKDVLARTVDALIVERMKEPLIKSATIYQIGGLPGHSINEHLITLKTIMAWAEKTGKEIVFMIMDIMSFFDKENIFDCLETMEKLNVNEKAARVWYKLNKDSEVTVKTTGGETKTAKVGDCLGQGTAGAGLVSQANLDHGLNSYFKSCKDVMYYGETRIQPLSYQDDVAAPCLTVNMARTQAALLASLMREKTLLAHPDKTGYLILGSEKRKQEIRQELENNPINFSKFNLKEKDKDKYLGQMIKSDIATSALETVKDRVGKIKGASIEIKAIIEEFQMQALAGCMAAW